MRQFGPESTQLPLKCFPPFMQEEKKRKKEKKETPIMQKATTPILQELLNLESLILEMKNSEESSMAKLGISHRANKALRILLNLRLRLLEDTPQ